MPTCWGITDGSAGMVAQVRALALAMGLDAQIKKATVKKPFVYLPNIVYGSPLRHLIVPYLVAPESDSLAPPWPDIVITCGRRAALLAMGMRARAKGKTRFIHIQDPQVSARYFDLVVAMGHDRITGANVLKTRFALHAITPAAMEQARQAFEPRFAEYAKPRVAVLLGGTTNKYTFTRDAMAKIVMQLQQFQGRTGASLLITPSRRTGDDNISMLRQTFAANKQVYIYDFIEQNPYMGMLALADAIVATNDSVNMMSEAHATGKPLYLLPLPGHTDSKPARFAEGLLADGIARVLGNTLQTWDYPRSNEMDELVEKIRLRIA